MSNWLLFELQHTFMYICIVFSNTLSLFLGQAVGGKLTNKQMNKLPTLCNQELMGISSTLSL